MTNVSIDTIRIAEIENGYKQCYNDVLLILIHKLASSPTLYGHLNDVTDEMKRVMEVREVTAWSHPEEIVNAASS